MKESTIVDKIISLFEQLKSYLELRAEHLRLTAGEHLIKLMGAFILRIIIVWVIFFFLFFCGLAFAYWFGKETGHLALGFLITAGMYLLLGLLIYVYRKPLIFNPLTRVFFKINGLDKNNNGKDEE